MKVLQQKLAKLKKEKNTKEAKREQLNSQINALDKQIKDISNLISQYEKLDEQKEKILHGNQNENKKNEEIANQSFNELL